MYKIGFLGSIPIGYDNRHCIDSDILFQAVNIIQYSSMFRMYAWDISHSMHILKELEHSFPLIDRKLVPPRALWRQANGRPLWTM